MLKAAITKAGITGRLVAHVMPWFNGDGKHPNVGYLSHEPWVVGQQLSCMGPLGFEEVCVTYSGSGVSQLVHFASTAMCYQVSEHNMKFSLLLNAAMVTNRPDKTVDPTTEVLNRLKEPEVQWMLNSTNYIPERTVYEFDLGPNGVDLAKVQAATGLTLASKHTGFTWPEKQNTLITLASDLKNPVKMTVIFPSFNDGNPKDRNKSVWDISKPVTIFDPMGGQFWHSQLKLVASMQPSAHLGTVWNDYEEGNTWEPWASALAGIRIG